MAHPQNLPILLCNLCNRDAALTSPVKCALDNPNLVCQHGAIRFLFCNLFFAVNWLPYCNRNPRSGFGIRNKTSLGLALCLGMSAANAKATVEVRIQVEMKVRLVMRFIKLPIFFQVYPTSFKNRITVSPCLSIFVSSQIPGKASVSRLV